MSAAAMVLVLDAEFMPLRIDPLRRAWKKIVLGKVEVIRHSHDQTVTVSGRVTPLPSVVRLLKHFNRNRIKIKFSRLNIYARDDFRCQYCGEQFMTEDLTFDHVYPQSRGGKTEWTNIVSCCVLCNHAKANRTPEEAGMRLLTRPRKPHFLPESNVRMDMRHRPVEWNDYWFVSLNQG
jgi:5-methylcytosine-specific restriction endonuclease McrA